MKILLFIFEHGLVPPNNMQNHMSVEKSLSFALLVVTKLPFSRLFYMFSKVFQIESPHTRMDQVSLVVGQERADPFL